MNQLAQPSLEFRPVPLWSWNDTMEPARCAEIIGQLAEAGYGGAYLHARLGMLISYMGPQYIDAILASIAAAEKFGIRAHLYDEDRWPSGWAGGAVPRADPSFRLKSLVRRHIDDPMSDDDRLLSSSGDFRYLIVTMAMKHPKFNGTCYTDITDPAAVRCFLERAYEPLHERLRNAFGRSVPTIFSDEPALTYLYTWPSGGLPWSDALPERFFAATEMRLLDVVDALFTDLPESAAIRLHYYRCLSELFAESFMLQISSWCHAHDIRWTGHFMYEHSLPLHFSWSANCHSSYRYYDWPGIDHLGRQVGEVVTAIGCRSAVHQFAKERMMSELFGASGQNLSFADRKWIAEQQLVLGANHLVPHLASTTLLGPRKRDYPPTLSAHQPWWPLNRAIEDHCGRLCQLLSEGVAETDLLVIHPQESMYPLSRELAKVGNADTWVGRFFHLAGDSRLNELDRTWKNLCYRLLNAGYVFDFGDEGVLADCGRIDSTVDPPVLRVGAGTYRAVLIPQLLTIRPTTLRLLADFVEAGGIIISFGDPPRMLDGRSDDQSQRQLDDFFRGTTAACATLKELIACLIQHTPPALRIEPDQESRIKSEGRIWRCTKNQDMRRVTFLVNLNRFHERRVSVEWRDAPKSQITTWHTHEAASEPADIDNRKLSLRLPPGGSCLVVEGDLPQLVPPPAPARGSKQYLDASSFDWKVTRLDPNTFVIDEAEFHTGDDIWDGPYPVLAIKEWLDNCRYTGPITLRYPFAAVDLAADANMEFIIEGVERPGVEVRVNGQEISTAGVAERSWCDPHWHPLLVPHEIISQRNHLELTIRDYKFSDAAANNLDRRSCTELESLIILGDFSADGCLSAGPQNWLGQIEHHTATPLADWLPPQRLHYYKRPFALRPPRPLVVGDLTSQGLPFYAGRIRYEGEFASSNPANQEIILRLDVLAAAVASVDVNGKPAGIFTWPPLELDIGHLLVSGWNSVSIVFYSSLRNLLGTHHHPSGEAVYVTPGSFRPEGCANWLAALRARQKVPNWADHYSFVGFGMSTPHQRR